jgi:uncharacterized repeat protein (TIGR03803 family)
MGNPSLSERKLWFDRGVAMIAKRLLTFGALIVIVFCVLLLVAAAQKRLQTETVLHNFGGFSGDGGLPYGGLLYHKGTLYGTTGENAPNGGSGTVFKIASTGKNYKVLYTFCSLPGCTDGGEPLDLAPGLVLRDGKLYGTTSLGGDSGYGTVFDLTLNGKENTLYGFDNQSGNYPEGGVVFDEEGNLYGTTWGGGEGLCAWYFDYISCGTVFEVTAAGEQSVLHSFGAYPGDGEFPFTGLVRDNEGNLYGTTYQGGDGCPSPFHGCGTVFEITSTGEEKILYSFGSQHGDGTNPYAGLVLDEKGNLYGTTTVGGAYGVGTVFEVASTGEEKILYSFGGKPGDATTPLLGSLVFDKKGNLYGTTGEGGIYGDGTVFELTSKGKEKILYSFGAQPNDGIIPEAGVVFDTAGNLYGTTPFGGTYGWGTVFKITPLDSSTD